MERDGEPDPELAPDVGDARRHARGRQGDPPPADGDALGVEDDPHRLDDVVVVVERLAHPHQHDVGDHAPAFRARPFAVGIAGQQHLAHDLRRAEVAHPGLGAGVAERAVERASDLRGQAERAPVLLGDEDGLGLGAVVEADEPFAGGVGGGEHARDAGAGDAESRAQPGPQRPSEGGHLLERGRAAMVDPVPDLPGAEGGQVEPGQRLGELRPAQPDQVAPVSGRRRHVSGRRPCRPGSPPDAPL